MARDLDSVSIRVGFLLLVCLVLTQGSVKAEEPPVATETTSAEEPDQVPELLAVTISGGGGETLTSSSFRMTGTVGPPDAGSASSPSFQMSGGFSGSGSVGNPQPLFSDGFESNNTGGWHTTVP